MTNKQLAAFLRRYNQWRRDDEGVMTMPHPKDIGEAIDKAIAVIESHSALIGLLRRWMPTKRHRSRAYLAPMSGDRHSMYRNDKQHCSVEMMAMNAMPITVKCSSSCPID